jgi:ElaB/YqjD/DUF883 family membrane-anchored ribosome-binding protein
MGERADVMREYGQPRDPDWQPAGESAESESPGELRVEIEETRVEMSGTIDAIQEKLNPDRLKEQVTSAVQEQVETVKENIHDATIGRAEEMVSNVGKSGLVETIKQNPIPAALAGLGIGWLLMNRQQGASGDRGGFDSGRAYYAGGGQPSYGRGRTYGAGSYGYGQGPGYGRGQAYYGPGSEGDDQSLGDRVGGAAGQAKESVADTASQAKEKVGQFTDQAQDQVGEWGGQVQYGARQAKSRFDQTLSENPLAVSAVAIALGLAVGMSLPDTPLEDKLMGEARDNVMEKAQATAQETMQKVGQVAQQVQQTATDTAKDAAQKQGLTPNASPQGSQQGAPKQSQSGTQPGGMQNMPKAQNSQPAHPSTTGQ